MSRIKPWQSVVTRLITCLLMGGLLISACLSVLEMSRAQAALRLELTQRITLTTRNVQVLLHGSLDAPKSERITQILEAFTASDPISAVRLTGPGLEPVTLGNWPLASQSQIPVWPLGEHAVSMGDEVDLREQTLLQAPFTHRRQLYLLEMMIDGPAARARILQAIFQRLSGQWLVLAVMTLFGLLLLRRWFTGPLSEVVELVGQSRGPEPFRRFARQKTGEFRTLADAIAQMLGRIETTSAQLQRREQAFHNLYQFAPTAMVSLNPEGRIIEANQRAADLFGYETTDTLIGREIQRFVPEEDQPLFQQVIDRLTIDEAANCELRMSLYERVVDVAMEATGVRDADGMLESVRLSLVDVTRSRQMQREIDDKRQMLNLIIDHMNDAILLVDASGKVAAFNQKLAALLQQSAESLQGKRYSHEGFWESLQVTDRRLFVSRLRQIEADEKRSAQERFATRAGTLLFQGIPLHDEQGKCIGRLWVVQEASSQEQSTRLLSEQNQSLLLVKRMGEALAGVEDLDTLCETVVREMLPLMQVEAVGIAIDAIEPDGSTRCTQLINRGSSSLLWRTNQMVVNALASELLSIVAGGREVAFWPDVPVKTFWGSAFNSAGLTCVAAAPIRGDDGTKGMIWIARRGGERLQRGSIHGLEMLAPIVAARLAVVQMRRQMLGTVTDLQELISPPEGLLTSENLLAMAPHLPVEPRR